MREPAEPQINGTGPDNRRPPRRPADDCVQLEDTLQQLQQMLEPMMLTRAGCLCR